MFLPNVVSQLNFKLNVRLSKITDSFLANCGTQNALHSGVAIYVGGTANEKTIKKYSRTFLFKIAFKL